MRSIRAVLVLAVSLAVAGCATVMSGSHDRVFVTSDPLGAAITVDGQPAGQTPARIDASRKNPPVVAITFDGCRGTHTSQLTRSIDPWVFGNALLSAVGFVGVVVDWGTGAMYSIQENRVGARCFDGRLASLSEIIVGMTAQQVRQAWGEPDSINRTQSGAGTSEQWVYGLGYYVYLENGRVTAIQTTEG